MAKTSNWETRQKTYDKELTMEQELQEMTDLCFRRKRWQRLDNEWVRETLNKKTEQEEVKEYLYF